jgi:hypothetical protein
MEPRMLKTRMGGDEETQSENQWNNFIVHMWFANYGPTVHLKPVSCLRIHELLALYKNSLI